MRAVVALGILSLVAIPAVTAQTSPAAAPSAITVELKKLYDADQADRQAPLNADMAHWEKVSERDHQRRERVMSLVTGGSLDVAEDYFYAAMILQHADGSDDILLSHILSTIAGFKGHKSAQWLSAASLDRFLHRTKQAQRLGTQYVRESNNVPWSQGAYDSSLPDKVRAEFGVPALAKQLERLAQMNKPAQEKPPTH